MTISLRKAACSAALGALGLLGPASALAEPPPHNPDFGNTGPGTAICGPSHGSFHAAGGPGYAQYAAPPVPLRVLEILGCPPTG